MSSGSSRLRAVRAARTLLFAAALAGCTSTPSPRAETSSPPVSRAEPPASTEIPPLPPEPKPLPGLESLTLEGRERALFQQLLSQLYAPCPSQAVSIQQCIEERRPCAACTPAALLLGEKIREGASADQAREMYGARFGSNLKKVDLTGSPSRGPADAPVTIVVWSDFECPHCRHALPIIEKVFEQHSPRVRLVHKFYPLRQHSHAAAAARAAIAAANQGKYWEMERMLFDNQESLTDSDLARYARELKLDPKRFAADLAAPRTGEWLERDHDQAEKAGLTGTPFILINGREFDTSHFHVNLDLDAWVTLELSLAGKP